MVQHIVTGVDGSRTAWRGAEQAFALARQLDVGVTLVHVEAVGADPQIAIEHLHEAVGEADVGDLDVDVEVPRADDGIAGEIANVAQSRPGALLVLASHGRGRSTALVGSVADELIREVPGGIVLVGPECAVGRLTGSVLIGVDGSELAERAVRTGVDLAQQLSLEPWIVHSDSSTGAVPDDAVESGYIASLAKAASDAAGLPVQFEELHGSRPAAVICDYARRVDAALIVASSHGRTGIRRVALGSVAAGMVRDAPCPVMVINQHFGQAD
jgi:nucleotide-binding universal stress UspA family protein